MSSRAVTLAALALLGCGNKSRNPVPERTTQGTSLHVSPNAMTPGVNIGPQGDAGAMNIQIGNAQVRLPGEDERARQAEREQEGR